MKKRIFLWIMFGLLMVIPVLVLSAENAEENSKKNVLTVMEGKTVIAHYTLTVDGKILDSSKEREPLKFQVGSQQVIPGFEKAVKGMKVGEKKTFQVGPEEGYGPEDPKAIQEVARDKLPADVKPEPGMTLYAKGMDGHPIPVRIMEVKKDVVIMNFNHPLAGKTLNFEVEVVEIL